jgi:septation ring formation regulator EzrA
MTKERIVKSISATLLAALTLSALPVFAQVGAGVRLNVSASTTGVKADAGAKIDAKMEKRISTGKSRGDQEIDRRVGALNKLKVKISEMTHLSDAGRSGVSAMFQAQIDALTNLKAKIDTDTEIEALKTDIKAVTQSYRIFALVIPQGRILVASDRMATVADALNELGNKLATRIAAASAAGSNVTDLANTLTDLGTKINDAKTSIQAAVTTTTNLKPDNGEEATFQANKDTLKDARKKLQTAKEALDAARKDARTIVKGLKSLKVGASVNATTTTGTSN